MKKMSKEEVLALPLESFGIRPLTLWVTRPKREMEMALKSVHYRLKVLPQSVENGELEKNRERCQTEIDSRPKTVGDLIEKYKYRFDARSKRGHRGSRYQVGLGSSSIAELKKKLLELGLTPDDWPALVPKHTELIDHLSKESIKKLPVLEVFTSRDAYLRHFFDCHEDEVRNKTLGDLFKIDPRCLAIDNMTVRYILKKHQRFLFTLRLKLHKKRFTISDGAFFRWNPIPDTYWKVNEILRKHGVPQSDFKRFADIIIAERWVI